MALGALTDSANNADFTARAIEPSLVLRIPFRVYARARRASRLTARGADEAAARLLANRFVPLGDEDSKSESETSSTSGGVSKSARGASSSSKRASSRNAQSGGRATNSNHNSGRARIDDDETESSGSVSDDEYETTSSDDGAQIDDEEDPDHVLRSFDSSMASESAD